MNNKQKKMMVSGQIRFKKEDLPAEIRRCMAVLSCDGHELGIVAAICLDPYTEELTAVLLGRLPVTADYRLIPIAMIDRVSEDTVHLRITAEYVGELAQHEAG